MISSQDMERDYFSIKNDKEMTDTQKILALIYTIGKLLLSLRTNQLLTMEANPEVKKLMDERKKEQEAKRQ